MSLQAYTVKLIHKKHDFWNAKFQFFAPGAAAAQRYALAKLTNPEKWEVVAVVLQAGAKQGAEQGRAA